MSTLPQETKDIRDITIAMIVAACIAAMLIATVITAGITRNIRKSIGRLDRVANGDLTVQEKRNGKRWRVWKTFRGIISYHYKNEIPDHDRSGNENEVLQSGECVMETSGKSMNGRECRIYHGGIWKHEQRHGEYDTGTG